MDGITACFTGRIGTDPNLNYTASGTAVLSFSLAVDQKQPPKDGQAQWVRVSCWKETAEQLAAHLKKGDLAYCEGKLTSNEWETTGGETRHGLNLSAWTCHPLGKIGERSPRRPRAEERELVTAGRDGGGNHDPAAIPF